MSRGARVAMGAPTAATAAAAATATGPPLLVITPSPGALHDLLSLRGGGGDGREGDGGPAALLLRWCMGGASAQAP